MAALGRSYGDDPGRRPPAGAPNAGVLAFHLDSDNAASRIVSHTLPRLVKLLDRGHKLDFWQNGRSVIVAWGEGASAMAKAAAAHPALSVAPHCTGWLQAGKPAPNRLCAFWPGRCWPLGPDPATASAAWSVLVEGPPAVWWGWNRRSAAVDSIRWPSLNERSRQFLEQLQLKAPRVE